MATSSTEQSLAHTPAWTDTEKRKIRHGILQLFYDVEAANPSNGDDINSLLSCLMWNFSSEAGDGSPRYVPWKQLPPPRECLHIPGRHVPPPVDPRQEFYDLFNSAAYAGYRYSSKTNSCPPLSKQDAGNHFATVWHAMFYDLFHHSEVLRRHPGSEPSIIDWPHALQHIYLPLNKRTIEFERDTVTAAWQASQDSSKTFVSYSTQQREHGAAANMALFARHSLQYTINVEDNIVCRFSGEFAEDDEVRASNFQKRTRSYVIESRRFKDRYKKRMLFYAGACAANFANSVDRSRGNCGYQTLAKANCDIMEYSAEDVKKYVRRYRAHPAPFLEINRNIAAGEELVTTYGDNFYAEQPAKPPAQSSSSQSNKRKAECITIE